MARPAQKKFRIVGTGMCVPEKVLTNADLEQMVETSDEWITSRTGIRERRIADEGTSTSTLAAGAVRAACEDAGMDPKDLDGLVLATSTADTLFPSTACWTQKHLNIKGMAAFDVSAGCSGWVYALEVASSLLATGGGKRFAVIGSEVMSKVVNWEDRTTCVLFGDGAGAAIIETTDEDKGLLASNWGCDGTLAPILYQPAGGTQRPATHATVDERLHTVHMEGNSVFRHAVRAMTDAAVTAMKDAEVTADEVDLLIPHQANLRIIEACRSRVNVPEERCFLILERFGNMSAATVPIALHEARKAGRTPEGSLVLTTAFGTGLTWGAGLLRL